MTKSLRPIGSVKKFGNASQVGARKRGETSVVQLWVLLVACCFLFVFLP